MTVTKYKNTMEGNLAYKLHLELLKERKMLNENLLDNLIKECDELVAIFTATAKTVRNKINAKNKKNENIEDCEWE
ncbi:MAG TPA: hypothetical protein PLG05_05290 [Bacteroidales bacterium]|nr:hypothetical protein [Bacteroidales bacterium]HPL04571.1 hypothetical protein [Bacteroidales bacterium]